MDVPWSIVIFAIKLIIVGAMALLLAVALALLAHTLQRGALPETKQGLIYTRVQNPFRFWLSIGGQVLFVSATAILIDAAIRAG